LRERHVEKQGIAFHELPDPWQTLGSLLERLGPDQPDMSARSFLEQNQIDAQTQERVRHLVEGFEAAPLDEVSIRSLRGDAQSQTETHRQSRVQGGYSTLVDYCLKKLLEARVEVRLQARVTQVEWQARGPVILRVEGEAREVRARTCIVTVPLPILQSSAGLRFLPGVSRWREAAAKLGMGHAARVMLQFPREFAERCAPRDAFIHQTSTLFETFWAAENDHFVQWTAWAGGPKAQELARESTEQRKHLALASLANLFGLPEATLSEALVCPMQHHDYSNDADIGGAYSFSRPGSAQALSALTEPIEGALFLAGEATDHEYPGTVAGAIASGRRAARQVLMALAS